MKRLHKFLTKNNLLMLGIGFGVIVVIFLIWLVYTPTTTITINNDTKEIIEATSCSYDPPTLSPHQSIAVDAIANDDKSACLIYNNQGNYLGCLSTPTTGSARTFNVSALERNRSEHACGD